MSADELILQRRQMSAKRKVIRLQRELHETKEAVRKAGADAAERLRLADAV